MPALVACVTSLVLALVVTAVLTPLARRLASRLGLLAHPAGDRWHRTSTPLLGGAAMVAGIAASLGWTADLRPLVPLLACAGLMFVLGTTDDVVQMKPATKLVGQVLIASLLVFLAPPLNLTGSTVLDQLLAVTWIVGITNAFNLLDNMDGVAAGVAAIGGLFYVGLLLASSSPLSLAAAALVGASLGFLVYNFPPASIFMGDGGSHLLGAFLAGVSLLAAPNLTSQLAYVAAVPLLILFVPILDTVFVTLTRGLAGHKALVGGCDHLSHRLVGMGIGERQALLLLYGLSALGGAIALGFQHVPAGYAGIFAGLYVVMILLVGVVLGHVDVGRSGSADAAPASPAPLVAELTYRHRVYEVLLDVALIAIAYYSAFRIRFQEPQFSQFLPYFARSFPIVVGTHLAALWWMGKYRHVWSTFGATELMTIFKGIALGTSASVILLVYLYRFIGFSRWVFVTNGALLAFLLVGSRVVITRTDEYLRRQRIRGRRALIYGAGKGGALLVRELLQNPDLGMTPVGFVDDDPAKRRLRIEGVRVLGSLADLAGVVRRHGISDLLVAIRDLPEARLHHVGGICEECGVRMRRMRFALEELQPHDREAEAAVVRHWR